MPLLPTPPFSRGTHAGQWSLGFSRLASSHQSGLSSPGATFGGPPLTTSGHPSKGAPPPSRLHHGVLSPCTPAPTLLVDLFYLVLTPQPPLESVLWEDSADLISSLYCSPLHRAWPLVDVQLSLCSVRERPGLNKRCPFWPAHPRCSPPAAVCSPPAGPGGPAVPWGLTAQSRSWRPRAAGMPSIT